MNDFKFNYGWRKSITILFEGKNTQIECILDAYDGEEITEDQKRAYQNYEANQKKYESIIHRLLNQYVNENNIEDYEIDVNSLFIQRNGDFALLCECSWDSENGIAVVLSPKEYITLQNNIL